jgi:type VI secretion system protein ImpK
MHMTDCFIQLIAYVVHFKQSAAGSQPAFEQVKADILRLLSESDNCARKTGFSQEDYDKARFMVCAWVDEVVLASAWNQRNLWQREQLQRLYYNTTDAGEEVFERLNVLEYHQREVREVYYLCLALGFKGRFIHQGDDFLLEQVKTSNLKLLLGSTMGIPSLERTELFPEAYPSGTAAPSPGIRRSRFPVVTLVAFSAPVLLFAALYLIYFFILGGIAENFIRMG